jgi:hypothetical protein
MHPQLKDAKQMHPQL